MLSVSSPNEKPKIRIDLVAFGVIMGLIVFCVIMFFIFRSQSKKSEHPDAQMSNASDPTPLHHAPTGSQSEYLRSLLSLKKPSTPELETDKTREEPKFKRRLFFEDTADVLPRRGSQVV